MKLISLHIKNYKSITDSKVCFLEPDMTIFAGKNESGKSSILEALYDFNFGSKINSEAIQIHNEDARPEITLRFEMSKEEQIEYFKDIKVERKVDKSYKFEITKTDIDTYRFDDDTNVFFEFHHDTTDQKKLLIDELAKSFEVLENYYNNHSSSSIDDFIEVDFDKLNLTSIEKQLEKYSEALEEFETEEIEEDQVKLNAVNLELFENSLQSLIDISKDVSSIRKNLLLNKIPNFILFKSFEDDIPNKVPFSELQKNEFIRDLEVVSDFDKSILTNGNDRKQSNHKESINIEFNKEYKEFWTQDNTSFEFDWHDKNLLVWIKENGQRYKPTERSKGKQWHLSFYIRVTARSNESKDNIILIDEPGMYLHAKAQSDIYNKLLKISKKTQTVFTTHSPYLLKYDEIDRIRLVNKSEGNSWINQKVHAGSDKETLTPLLTSIGLELNTEIHSLDKLYNVVVEGPSDFYYLQAIKMLLDFDDFNFIFGGGSTKMPFVGTILAGWGCHVIYLFDNDQGRKQGEKTLAKDWYIDEKDIEAVIDKKGSVEDIWSSEFFKEFVLGDPTLKYTDSNSEYVKKSDLDKVLVAKLFLAKVRSTSVKIDKQTRANLTTLVERIRKKLKK